jgi:hypothetical protein
MFARRASPRLWLAFGALAGLGLENKHSMLVFGVALVAGLFLTGEQRQFRSKWIWIGGAIAFLLLIPNLIWSVQHHFPFAQLMANVARSGRNVSLRWWQFLWQQAELMLPPTLPVWLTGLGYLLFHRDGRKFAPLAITYLFILVAMIAAPNGRPYYVGPAYPMLFAAGAVALDGWLSRPGLGWLKPEQKNSVARSLPTIRKKALGSAGSGEIIGPLNPISRPCLTLAAKVTGRFNPVSTTSGLCSRTFVHTG